MSKNDFAATLAGYLQSSMNQRNELMKLRAVQWRKSLERKLAEGLL